MLRRLSLVGAALFALAGSAEAKSPTILVIPLDGSVGSGGYAAALRLLAALDAKGGVNIVHLKQYNRVVEHHEHKLAELTVRERRKRMAISLGADYIVSGSLKSSKGKLNIKLDVAAVRGDGAANTELRADNLVAALDGLPEKAFASLAAVGALPDAELPKNPVAATSKVESALLDYAACHRLISFQPVGVREPVLLDRAALDEAIDLCESARKADPEMPDPRAALGFAHALNGNRKDAELYLASVKDTKLFLSYYWIGKFWVVSRYYDTDAALDVLRAAIKRSPGFLLGRGYLGDALAALGRYKESQEVYLAYLETSPEHPFVMGRIGYAAAKQGEIDQAVEWTKKALRVAPADSELMLELAGRLIDGARFDDAISVLRRIISEGGARGEVHLRLGYALLKTDQLPSAEREFQNAIRKSRSLSEWRTRGRARYDLAKLWMRQENPPNAIRQLRMAARAGFKDERAFTKDPDLAPLAKDPEFVKLLKSEVTNDRPTLTSPFDVDADSGELVEKTDRKGKKRIKF